MARSITVILLALALANCHPGLRVSESKTLADNYLENLLRSYPAYFDTLLARPGEYNIQVIYTRIDRNKKNEPSFTDYTFYQNPGRYFYPASTVKLPIALLSLQKLNQMQAAGVNMDCMMITDA